jgi:hypothetical protein
MKMNYDQIEWNLEKSSLYGDIRNWFMKYLDLLPEELDSKEIIYTHVRMTAKLWIIYVDGVIEKHGRPDGHAKVNKDKLLKLYFDLQNFEGWGVGLSEKIDFI